MTRFNLTAILMTLCVAILNSGCGLVKKQAISMVADSLAGDGTAFSSDNDPQLIKDSIPFSLKLAESLLAEDPENENLLLTLCSGFTQYGVGFIAFDAQKMEDDDYEQSERLNTRAANLCIRGRDYGLRALESKHAGFTADIRELKTTSLHKTTVKDVETLYWTAAAWGSAISLSKDDPARVATLPAVELLIDRAYELDPDFNKGALHSFLMSYEMSRQGISDDERTKRVDFHYKQALALTENTQAAPYVTYAESVLIQRQDHTLFTETLEKALAIDVNKSPDDRLMNIIMQDKAQWLLSRIDEYFLIPEN